MSSWSGALHQHDLLTTAVVAAPRLASFSTRHTFAFQISHSNPNDLLVLHILWLQDHRMHQLWLQRMCERNNVFGAAGDGRAPHNHLITTHLHFTGMHAEQFCKLVLLGPSMQPKIRFYRKRSRKMLNSALPPFWNVSRKFGFWPLCWHTSPTITEGTASYS